MEFLYLGNHENTKVVEEEFKKTRMRGPDFSELNGLEVDGC